MINDDVGGTGFNGLSGLSAGQMRVSLEQLDAFEKRVLGVLDQLMRGPVGGKPAGEPMAPGGYGTGFAESDFVQRTMGRVIVQLEVLAGQLRAQIEVMALSLRMAGSKTAEADVSNRAEMARALALSRQQQTPAGHSSSASSGGQPARGID
ncbi:hypothetical protein [Yinghuangia sp. YIM S09857]|uniref:hypothetical protein n=1 Tax=Yinghuangia sp. YIM S09857 TaxID=3436929 RepID=UPI003F5308D8